MFPTNQPQPCYLIYSSFILFALDHKRLKQCDKSVKAMSNKRVKTVCVKRIVC